MSLPFGTLPPLSVSPGATVADPLPPDRPVRWGILATGKIASGFAQALQLLPDAELAAVASRRLESAERFALAYGGPATRSYGSYAALVEDPDVDVVYVATPHALHHEHTMLAFDAGKPVLCEKALTLTAREAEDLVRVSRERRLFLMEAMWTRFLPSYVRLVELLGEEASKQGILQLTGPADYRQISGAHKDQSYWLERIDYTYQQHRFWTGQDFGGRMPSEVFDEHVLTCFIDDRFGVALSASSQQRKFGSDNIESDGYTDLELPSGFCPVMWLWVVLDQPAQARSGQASASARQTA